MLINAVYRVLDSPKIWLTTGPKRWGELRNEGVETAYLLAHPMWRFGWKSAQIYHRERAELRKRKIRLILLNNSQREHRFARRLGFDSVLLNQNMHCCEHVFRPVSEQKIYDAVYVAAAKPYKRIHLASDVDRLFVVTYFWPDVRDSKGQWDLHTFEPRVRECDFNTDRLSADEVNRVLNKSRCALALSKKEGAMFASMEYMMAGLPIVSTPSVGGRDFFFDDRFVRIASPSSEAVAAAVSSINSKSLEPQFIRAETMSRVAESRRAFHAFVAELAGPTEQAIDPFEAFADSLWGPPDGLAKHRLL